MLVDPHTRCGSSHVYEALLEFHALEFFCFEVVMSFLTLEMRTCRARYALKSLTNNNNRSVKNAGGSVVETIEAERLCCVQSPQQHVAFVMCCWRLMKVVLRFQNQDVF